jgi:hypothetical protein
MPFLLTLILCLLSACAKQEPRRSAVAPPQTQTHYAGRFRFDVPLDFEKVGQGSSLRGVDIEEVTLPPAPSEAEARDAFWKAHVDKVEKSIARTSSR